jgi:hypothetical protein
MERAVSAPLWAVCLCAGMLLLLEAGRRLGGRRIARGLEGASTGLGAVEGTAFALLGLLLAFTFSGAGSRFDFRRQQIAEESNAVGTAYLRLDLLPAESQPALRELFRNYLDARLGIYRNRPGSATAQAERQRSETLQKEIWARAVVATNLPGGHPDAGKLLLPALNEMIDITTLRTMAALSHPPKIIYGLLFVLAFGCALMAGHAMAGSQRRSWLHILGFVAATVITVFVILDVEYPRHGLFRLDAYDQMLIDLRASMQ